MTHKEAWEASQIWLSMGYWIARLATDLSEWSQATFGTDEERGPVGPLKHLEKEAREAQAKPDDVFEYADALILVLDASRRAGFDLETLLDAAIAKLARNRDRTWQKPSKPDEPIEHVRDPEADAVSVYMPPQR